MGLDIDLPGIARSVRYNAVHTVSDMNGLKKLCRIFGWKMVLFCWK